MVELSSVSIPRELLPESMRDMAGRIGLADTVRIAGLLGGITIRIPEGKNSEGQRAFQELVGLVGERLAHKLRYHYQQEEIYIPRLDRAYRAVRNRHIHTQIKVMGKNGISKQKAVRRLSIENDISDRRIWEILKEPVPNILFPAKRSMIFQG
ncbi:hypothetical protein LX59_03009 [Azomonas agilis]|uniref:Mor transcription activator family protein n=1 Tax=Azomonas agilis TaxID=116849 RepID=A0A562HZL9_9GAMM|nr:hypothetical protein [Azomonas agilis]TWH63845.1 hypothetical protein LX59_03009 [Azomonas agilis]